MLPLLDRIASDPVLRKDLAGKAMEGYRDHYSEARWMEHYFEIIENINDATAS